MYLGWTISFWWFWSRNYDFGLWHKTYFKEREYKNIYEEQNVYELIDKIVTYNEFNKIYQLDDKISFQFLQNSHCIGAVQIQLILNNGIKRKKILYSSDIGSLNKKNHYVDKTIIQDPK